MSQKNSFITLLEQIAILNQNSINIITALSDVVSTNASTVTVNQQNPDGTTGNYQLPTVSTLMNQINLANTNIQKILGLEGSTYVINGTSSKKVYALDLNREPVPIYNVGLISNFVANPNWFFESLMNPQLSVDIDLTGQLDNNVNQVRSRKYIIQFDEVSYGTLSQDGTDSYNYFADNFLGQTNITESELMTWLTNANNKGVYNAGSSANVVILNGSPTIESIIDEETFDLNLQTLALQGTFSVIGQASDSINNIVWYGLNTLTYNNLANGGTQNLAVGDLLILNSKNSASKYQITNVSNNSSVPNAPFAIAVQIVEGYDPIPIGQNVLSYYSNAVPDQTINISVGYNEYNVIFIKPINTDNNLIGTVWSLGSAFYTGDLVLTNSPNNQNLSNFYLRVVNDYGILLKDLGSRLIPTVVGVTPNAPVLTPSDYVVEQTNSYLTNSPSYTGVEQNNQLRLKIKSQIASKQKVIIDLNNQLSMNKNLDIDSTNGILADIANYQNDIDQLNSQLYSITNQILNATVDASVEPQFSARGFFEIPAPIVQTDANGNILSQQNVVQFEIEYTSFATNGSSPAVNAYTLTGSAITGSTTGYFSKWNLIVTPVRSRTYDYTTETWSWNPENITDPEAVNINQIDIPIHPNESVTFQVRSISEVGFPDSLIYSPWSNQITIDFPTALANQSLSIADQNIVPDTYTDQAILQVNQNLTTLGLPQHLATSTYLGQSYFAHLDANIITTFTDANGNNLDLYSYLLFLTNRITTLEQIVQGAKGILSVQIVSSNGNTTLGTGSIQTITVECEDYGTPIQISSAQLQNIDSSISQSIAYRTYYNNVYTIKDFYLSIQNASSANSLGLLSDRLYTTGGTNVFYTDPNNQMLFVDSNNNLWPQYNNQYVWFYDTVGGSDIYSANGINNPTDYQNPAISILNTLNSTTQNIGYTQLLDQNGSNYPFMGGGTLNILASATTTPNYWVQWDSAGNANNLPNAGGLCASVHPVIEFINGYPVNNIVDSGQDQEHILQASDTLNIPINIYFRFDGSDTNAIYPDIIGPNYSVGVNDRINNTVTRSIRIYIEQDGQQRPFDTTIQFIIRQHKISTTSTYNQTTYTPSNPLVRTNTTGGKTINTSNSTNSATFGGLISDVGNVVQNVEGDVSKAVKVVSSDVSSALKKAGSFFKKIF